MKGLVIRMLTDREPEEAAGTLHPTVSRISIDHIEHHGYIVTAEHGLVPDIQLIIQRNRHLSDAQITALVMERIRGRK